jgi:hypothetical protein
MACTENIRAIFALRGAYALYSSEIDMRGRCSRVLETEIERQKFMYNVLDFLSMRMCKNDSAPKLVMRFDTSYLPGSGNSPSIALRIYNGQGQLIGSGQKFAYSSPSEIVDSVIASIDFSFSASFLPDPVGLSSYFKSAEDELTIIFKPGYIGYFDAQYSPAAPPTIDSYVNVYGSTVATIECEQGGIRGASTDPDAIKRIGNWYSRAISSWCSDKVYMTNMGNCPPPEYIPCSALSSNMITPSYFDTDDENAQGGPVNLLRGVRLNSNNSLVTIQPQNFDQITITEMGSGDVYVLQYSAVAGGSWIGYWRVIEVYPGGIGVGSISSSVQADEIPILQFEEYTLGGSIGVITSKGNACQIGLKNSFMGQDIASFPPPLMSLTEVKMDDKSISGVYSNTIVTNGVPIVSLYRDGVLIYEWMIGNDNLVDINANQFILSYPSGLLPLTPGVYSFSWPIGWVSNQYGFNAPAVTIGTYTFEVLASAVGFPYTFPYQLS